jgi:hypothetical protein
MLKITIRELSESKRWRMSITGAFFKMVYPGTPGGTFGERNMCGSRDTSSTSASLSCENAEWANEPYAPPWECKALAKKML